MVSKKLQSRASAVSALSSIIIYQPIHGSTSAHRIGSLAIETGSSAGEAAVTRADPFRPPPEQSLAQLR